MRFLQVLRYTVFVVFVLSAGIALAASLVRNRRVNPFSPLGRALRGVTEPFVRPVERWLVGRGGNPQHAGLWIFGFAVIGGILIIAAANWIVGQAAMAGAMATSGRGVFRLVVLYAGRLLMLALLIRVIASWFGQFRYSRWMRPVYFLTDWMIRPLQKIIPAFGPFDFTPLIAWFALQLLLGWLMRVL